MMFPDWWSGQVALQANELSLDQIRFINRYGETERIVERWASTRMRDENSYSENYQIRRSAPCPRLQAASPDCPPLVLEMSGNPTKFIQGHNVFGPPLSDLHALIMACIRRFPKDLQPSISAYPSPADAAIAIHSRRIDITTMIDLGSEGTVKEWLTQAGRRARTKFSKTLVKGDTLYWGGKRWGMKAYYKPDEMAVPGHQPDTARYNKKEIEALHEYCKNFLRLELTLRTRELFDLEKANIELNNNLLWKYFDKIEVSAMNHEISLNQPNLPRKVMQTWRLWLAGHKVQEDLSRRNFYYYRQIIREETGLDISGSPEAAYDRYPRENLNIEFLKAHEVKSIPDGLQYCLWHPEEVTTSS